MKSKRLALLSLPLLALLITGCSGSGDAPFSASSSFPDSSNVSFSASSEETSEKVYDVEEAILLAQGSDTTNKEYLVRGIVKSFANYYYGQCTLTDGNGHDIDVYGLRGETDSDYFSALPVVPMVGDTIVIRGVVKLYNGTAEMGVGHVQSVEQTHEVPDLTPYQAKTIAEGRASSVGSKVRFTGVVASLTHTQKMNYNGFYLVDETGSIFVYGGESTSQVQVGNTVTVVGEVDRYIASSEKGYANQFGYQGAIQIKDTYVVSNDKGNSPFSRSWMKKTTMKEILSTSVKEENITSDSYLVTGVVKKDENTDYVNYYLDDLDGRTGGRVYTSNSGDDFKYLDPLCDQIVDMVVSPINCKSTVSGVEYRFIPLDVKVVEDFSFDLANAPQFALDYVVLDQFQKTYYGDPELEVATSYSNSLIGIDGLSISYSSSNSDLAYFLTEEGKTVFHTSGSLTGKATITATASLGSYSASSSFDVEVASPSFAAKTVKEAVDAEEGDEITVKGVVMGKVLNKVGFYVGDDTGVIAVQLSSKDDLSKVETGDEVIVKGKRTFTGAKGNYTGQINLSLSSVLAITSKGNSYSHASIQEVSFEDLVSYDMNTNRTAELFRVNAYATIYTNSRGYSMFEFFADEASSKNGGQYLKVYTGNNDQYAFLESMNGKQVTVELALCYWNWNGKYLSPYQCCPFWVSDGTNTVVNPIVA